MGHGVRLPAAGYQVRDPWVHRQFGAAANRNHAAYTQPQVHVHNPGGA